jgi:peroxygenase
MLSVQCARRDLSQLDSQCADEDGVIFPVDTFRGFRRLGYNPVLSALAGFFINSAMTFATNPSIVPDLRLPIYTSRIHRAKQ